MPDGIMVDGEYRTFRLGDSVGVGGRNLEDDVKLIQAAFNNIASVWGAPEDMLDVSGQKNDTLFNAVRQFQKRQFGWQDGLITPRGATFAKMGQIILENTVDIVCIDGAGPKDEALIQAREIWEGELQVLSIADLVDKVLKLLAADTTAPKKIQSLAICGHGGPGIQGCGCGHEIDKSGYKAILVDPATGDNGTGPDARLKGDADNQFCWLNGLFAPDGVVILSGCRVAANAKWRDGTGPVDGKELLKAVSRSIGGGVWVEASEFKQNMTPGMEGNCIRCNTGTCGVVTDGGNYFWGPIGGKWRPQ